jgi:hypothetical protein
MVAANDNNIYGDYTTNMTLYTTIEGGREIKRGD